MGRRNPLDAFADSTKSRLKKMLQSDFTRSNINKCPGQLTRPTGAAELLSWNKTAGSFIIPASYKFSILYNILARRRRESRWSDIHAGFYREPYDLSDAFSWIPTPDNERKTQFKDYALSVDREDGRGTNHPLLAGKTYCNRVPAIVPMIGFKGERAETLTKNSEN